MARSFDEITVPDDCPDWCEYLIVTPDMYDTGDSPTGYECDCPDIIDCPLYDGDMT